MIKGIIHAALVVREYEHTDNFDSDYASFRSAGIEFTEGPWEDYYGKVAVFKDLYGNRIDLIEPRIS